MDRRINYSKVAPEGIRALGGLETYLQGSGLEVGLLNLIKTRASQLNGCAYCIDMHTKDARARGETEQRLYTLPAWRATPFYIDRERAALAWAEAVTIALESERNWALPPSQRRLVVPGASHFAATAIASPSWRTAYQVATIGDHTFYKVQSLKPRRRG